MDDMFISIEDLVHNHRSQLKPILMSCIAETGIDLDVSPQCYSSNLGDSAGVMSFNIYGDPVGYILYEKSNPLAIIHFWAHPRFRRRKIGTRMFSYVSRKEKSNIAIVVNEKLLKAQLFLKNLGYKCTKIIGDRYVFMTNTYNPINRLREYEPQKW